MKPTVVCHSEYRYAQRPVSFFCEGERIHVTAALVEWCTPEGRGFKVQADNGRFFNLFYNQLEECWETKEV